MAIYHLTVKTGSRLDGQSASAKAQYICRIGDYERGARGVPRDAVLATRSGHMPGWARESAGDDAFRRWSAALRYWEAADRHERANGRLYVEVEFALPIELGHEDRVALVERFAVDRAILPDGAKLPYTWAIHAGGGTNPHVHLMISERVLDGIDRSPETWFKRAAVKGKPPVDGGARKTDILAKPEWLRETREQWERAANFFLQAAGSRERIDHRSHADRGIDELPGEHVGWSQRAARARDNNIKRRSVNDAVRRLRAERAQILNGPGATRAPIGLTSHDRRSLVSRPGVDAGIDADRGDQSRVAQLAVGSQLAAAPGHANPAGSGVAGLAGARPDAAAGATGTRAADEPRANAVDRGAAPARDLGVLHVSRGRVDVGPRDPTKLLHGDQDLVIHARGSDRHHGVRRQDAGAGNAGWIAGVQPQASGPTKLRFGRPGRELLEAQRAIQEWAHDFCARMEALISRIDAIKASAKAAKVGSETQAQAQAPSLAKTPTLMRLTRLTATSLRPVAALGDRGLREQLQIAERGEAAIRVHWLAALNARDPDLTKHYRMQHAAREARVEALRAEISRREAAVPAPASLSVATEPPKTTSTSTTRSEDMSTMSTDQLLEQRQITQAALREAARLVMARAGTAAGLAAAERLRAATARAKAIQRELDERAAPAAAGEAATQAQAVPPVAAGELAETAPAEVVRGPQALEQALEAARMGQAGRAAQQQARAVQQLTPEQLERARRGDYDVPGRRRRT